jgi:hypothetical protein
MTDEPGNAPGCGAASMLRDVPGSEHTRNGTNIPRRGVWSVRRCSPRRWGEQTEDVPTASKARAAHALGASLPEASSGSSLCLPPPCQTKQGHGKSSSRCGAPARHGAQDGGMAPLVGRSGLPGSQRQTLSSWKPSQARKAKKASPCDRIGGWWQDHWPGGTKGVD